MSSCSINELDPNTPTTESNLRRELSSNDFNLLNKRIRSDLTGVRVQNISTEHCPSPLSIHHNRTETQRDISPVLPYALLNNGK